MNERFLFRGKILRNGAWVYGAYLDIDGGLIFSNTPDFEPEPIVPNTVGQCTGCVDINGRYIFEGDIIKKESEDCFGRKDVEMLEVSFVFGCWKLKNKHRQCDDSRIHLYFNNNGLEVIGNIHDTPELLESAHA